MEAVRTNVRGTENVLHAAVESGVKRVICLSADKAVYPINAMGISKAMMEKLMVAASRNLEGTGMKNLLLKLEFMREGVWRGLGDGVLIG